MILPAIYAVLVWALAMRFRRRWPGYAVVAAGVLGLVMVDASLRRIDRAMPRDRTGAGLIAYAAGSGAAGSGGAVGGSGGPAVGTTTFLLRDLLRPYILAVGLVGLYVASLPRRAPSEAHCPRCFYDLGGLDPRGLVCPECGAEQAYRCVVCGCDLGDRDPAGLVCPDCGTAWRGPGADGLIRRAPLATAVAPA